MPNTMWISIGSILFGSVALILPVIGLFNQKSVFKKMGRFTFLSLSACDISLCLQVFYADLMTRLQDWSGLMDTMDVTAWVSATLLILVLVLNAIFVAVEGKKGGSAQNR